MNALIVINDSNQDESLKVAFDAAMGKLNWEIISGFETSYIKNYSSTDSKEIEKLVQKDVDAATFDAEWEKLKFILVILETSFKYMTSA